MKHAQRGLIAAIWLYIAAGAAIIGGIWYVYHTIDTHWETSAGIARGEANKLAEWEKANRDAEAAAEKDRGERARLAARQSQQLAAAQGRARDAEAQARRARAEAARAGVPLVVAQCPDQAGSVPAPAPGGGGLRATAPAVRFSFEFVREWDAAWTGQAGQPVFPDPGGSAQAAGAASAIDASAVLDNHAENASRCSANSRQLGNLIDLLEKLRAR